MKLKGISPIEQHCDKIAVGLSGAAAVGVVALTFLTQPNAVQPDGKGQFVPPAEAFAPAESAAKTVLGSLDSATLDVPEVPKLTLTTRFDAAMVASSAGQTRVALGNGRKVEGGAIVAATMDRFASLNLPAPQLQGAACYQATVSPIEQLRNKELAALLPTEQPFDKAYVSVEGIFNGTALRDLLEADPDGDGPMVPVPSNWWKESGGGTSRDLVVIAGVEIERRVISLPSGATPPSETTIISGMPGRAGLLGTWSKLERAGDVPPMIDQAEIEAERLQRPAFYSTIAGPEWVPPSEVVLTDEGEDNSRQIERERKRLTKLDEELADLRQRLSTAPTAQDQRRRREEESRNDQRSRPGGGGGKSGGGAGPSGRDPNAREDRKVETREAIQGRIDNKLKERERVAQRLVALGEDEATVRPADDAANAAPAKVASLLESSEVKVWAHDVTAERGAVYQYRLRVVLNNPMFGRALSEEQASLGHDPLVRTQWTDWTEPVEVFPAEYFFITNAETGSELSPRPRATAEMFQFYYGFYRRATVSVEPGDTIAGEAKLPPDLKFADMKKLEEILADPATAALPGSATPPPAPRPLPSRDQREPGPARGPRGLAPGQGPIPGDAPPSPQGGGTEPTITDAILTEAAPKSRVLKVDAMMMDVAPIPTTAAHLAGAARTRYLAVFRDLAGRLVTRIPDADRSQKAYRALEESARKGLNQGKVEVKDVKPEGERPPRAPREPRPGGGGGGGGGGG